ncbi:hypothetical protein EDB89DRAFT_360530 [Lactarius sanguifluus]|nr:hypothetical protein EDB89DRAFT_360530 [Lactarius sanguifluus]
MVDTFELMYLVEGEMTPFYVYVSYISDGKPTEVDGLRKNIVNGGCRFLARDYKDLTLLKPFPLLRFSKEDKGVEELSPGRMIDQIWPEPPPAHQIHIFVKFTGFLPKVATSRIILEAAHLMYYASWGKDLNDLLQDVPGHGNLQYLPQAHIDNLGLKHFFFPQVLVYEEYKVAYESFKSCANDPVCGGVVVGIQPRILMLLLLSLTSLVK